MRMKNGIAYAVLALSLSTSSLSLAAPVKGEHYTASISSTGDIQAQSPDWIAQVKHSRHPGPLAYYEIIYKPGAYAAAPSFCTVSLTDTRDTDDLHYGHARLAAAPSQSHVAVLTQFVGSESPAPDSSQSFMLLCIR